MSDGRPLRAGVIGVGSMGENHVRVYDQLDATTLAGVFDVREDRAAAVADTYGTTALDLDALLDAVDVVSVTVPTRYHHVMARECLTRGVDTLVEKPFVADPEKGRELAALAADHDATLQVGHIERFNPAVRALDDVLPGLDVISMQAERLGPPPDREVNDNAVRDLMIHDVDVVTTLCEGEVVDVEATGTAAGRYAVANLTFGDGVVCNFTASRVTQEKVRRLIVTARECRVKVDYIDQAVEIHRASAPEYVRDGTGVRYHHENVVERLTVERQEPLKAELDAFARAAATGADPPVTAEDGLRAIRLVEAIDSSMASKPPAEGGGAAEGDETAEGSETAGEVTGAAPGAGPSLD
ncbi:MAG: Gfo/Idh/MocA family oxidoreductase [Haloarculaceae archaeon]